MEQPELSRQILDTWAINCRLNVYLLESIPPEAMALKVEKSKSVGGHFAHIHSVRLMWLKAAAPALLEGLEKLDDKAGVPEVLAALDASSKAMGSLLEQGLAAGRIKNFKPHPTAFLGYLLAHEAFHRSQAELVLRQAGAALSDKAAYGLWEWGTR